MNSIRGLIRGGMATKLEAAKLVTTPGIPLVMCHGRSEDAVLHAARGIFTSIFIDL